MNNLAYNYDDVWEEKLDGKIVLMSPRPVLNHNRVLTKISRLFGNYLEGKPCEVFSDGVDVKLTENDTVIPDVMVVCDKSIIKDDVIQGAPSLIVEILSPSTAKRDKGYKKELYEKCGVLEYWIVDTASKSIEVYLLKNGRYILDEVYSVLPESILKKMTDEEREAVKYNFKTSLFDDLVISVEDIFRVINN
ncbi:MAG: Uma2 family endonuclease [Oscillospiraceae bacterium]|nr:Uma2 family endonuclease [Oscillospiraceae bacterium]